MASSENKREDNAKNLEIVEDRVTQMFACVTDSEGFVGRTTMEGVMRRIGVNEKQCAVVLDRFDSGGCIEVAGLFQWLFCPDQEPKATVSLPEDLIQVNELQLSAEEEQQVNIESTEDRAITVPQLEALLAYVSRHCRAEAWTSSNPYTPDELLHPETINLYDVVHWVVKPATRTRRCSYVELVARSVQVPRWFVSHWWGEPVHDFVRCLAQHRHDRRMPEDSPYWVCAYANNQWRAAEEVGKDPGESSFKRAMEKAQGTVTVLDEKAVTYTRVWCAYEIFVSLTTPDASYLYDVYTVTGDSRFAVGLTEGIAAGDEGAYHALRLRVKMEREQRFPLALAEQALGTDVYRANASCADDKTHILNAIAGVADLDAEPPAAHANYDRVNRLLRGHFAAGCWRIAVEQEQDSAEVAKLSKALRESGMEIVHLEVASMKQLKNPNTMELLAQALPMREESKHLEVHLYRNDLQASEATPFLDRIGQLFQLRHLKLYMDVNSLGNDGAAAVAASVGQLENLEDLTLVLGRTGLGQGGEAAPGLRGLGQLCCLRSLNLNLDHNALRAQGAAAVVAEVGRLQRLEQLHLRITENELGGGTEATPFLRGLTQLKHLRQLKLSLDDNNLGALGTAVAVADIGQLQGLEELTLCLRGNGISLAGEAAEAAPHYWGLWKLPRLRLLILRLDKNQLGAAGAAALVAELGRNTNIDTLELRLGSNALGTDGEAANFLNGFDRLQHLRHLTLDLESNSLGDEGAVGVTTAVAQLEGLESLSLHLRKNEVTCEGEGRGEEVLARLTGLKKRQVRWN